MGVLLLLRFMGYVGVGFCIALVPYLVYALTGSLKLGGLALLVEWIPKLGMYIFGGAILARYSSVGVHRLFEVCRLVVFLLFVGCVVFKMDWYWVAVGAMLYQLSNALSNILFDSLVQAKVREGNLLNGYSQLGFIDQLGSAVSLGLIFFLVDLNVVLWVALGIQLLQVVLVWMYGKDLHSSLQIGVGNEQSLGYLVREAFKGIDGPLRRLLLLNLLAKTPYSFIFSIIAFILAKDNSVEVTASLLAGLALVRMVVTTVFSSYIVKVTGRNPDIGLVLAHIGIVFTVVSVIWLMLSNQSYLSLASAITLCGLGASAYSPWSRTLKQGLLAVDSSVRVTQQGMLVAIEAMGYILGGILGALASTLDLALFLSVAPLVVVYFGCGLKLEQWIIPIKPAEAVA